MKLAADGEEGDQVMWQREGHVLADPAGRAPQLRTSQAAICAHRLAGENVLERRSGPGCPTTRLQSECRSRRKPRS